LAKTIEQKLSTFVILFFYLQSRYTIDKQDTRKPIDKHATRQLVELTTYA